MCTSSSRALKRSWLCPTARIVPGLRKPSRTRTLLMNVPLVDRLSISTYPESSCTMRQWYRDTVSSLMTMSLSSMDPMRISSFSKE